MARITGVEVVSALTRQARICIAYMLSVIACCVMAVSCCIMTMRSDHHGSILMLFKLPRMTYVYGSRLGL